MTDAQGGVPGPSRPAKGQVHPQNQAEIVRLCNSAFNFYLFFEKDVFFAQLLRQRAEGSKSLRNSPFFRCSLGK